MMVWDILERLQGLLQSFSVGLHLSCKTLYLLSHLLRFSIVLDHNVFVCRDDSVTS